MAALEIDVVCKTCSSALDADLGKSERYPYGQVLSIEPCAACMEKERLEGQEEGAAR